MVAALDSSGERPQPHLSAVPGWFEDWEQRFSRFRPDSELSQMNRSSGFPWKASREMWQVFQAARAAEEISDGMVNPLTLQALEACGYKKSFSEIQKGLEGSALSIQNSSCEAACSKPTIPLSSVKDDPACHTLLLPPGSGLDFGGITKGWAAHQAMNRLKIYGPALVNAGGDIAISGLMNTGEPWKIGIDDPFNTERDLELIEVGRAGVATSGRDYRRWLQGSQSRHHLIDPRTGEPACTDLICVTVIASDVLRAETAAKTILILGSQAGWIWLERQPALAALLVFEDGRQRSNARFDAYRAH